MAGSALRLKVRGSVEQGITRPTKEKLQQWHQWRGIYPDPADKYLPRYSWVNYLASCEMNASTPWACQLQFSILYTP